MYLINSSDPCRLYGMFGTAGNCDCNKKYTPTAVMLKSAAFFLLLQ